MIQLTKIFHFETAHAIKNYDGACKHIHGHSYELHVTVSNGNTADEYIASTGIMFDFKALKQVVHTFVINNFDHRLLLSAEYAATLEANPIYENIFIMEVEPTAENLLIFIKRNLETALPLGIKLVGLKLYETKDSYAEWVNK